MATLSVGNLLLSVDVGFDGQREDADAAPLLGPDAPPPPQGDGFGLGWPAPPSDADGMGVGWP
ncbi:hypothetical protein [Longimicrobium sp.]|uniref:hypothetical protein n=1 Tax=Longimicrobium sp. TaxID=2029185 RepID=UPI002E2F1947|nr:hypothetical protein [Longimicrobium sp.]HEX6037084.1 hypothetical protein [Longimicrobium sp.]